MSNLTYQTNIERIAPIPGSDGLTISDLGILRDKDGNIIFCENNQGYYVKTLKINGEPIRVRIHRLVMEVFSPERKEGQDQVNHKNGLRHDNRLENLEWVSLDENLEHGRETKGSTVSFPIDLWNIEDDIHLSADSAREAAKFTCVPVGWETILRWTNYTNDVVHTGGWRVKRREEEWIELDIDTINPATYRVGHRINVMVRDFENNVDLIFNSQREAANHTGVLESVVSGEVNTNRQRIVNDKWVFKYLDVPWREFKTLMEEIRDNDPTRCPIIAYRKDGEQETFTAVKVASRELGIGDSTIHYSLETNADRPLEDLRFNKFGYAFKYL